MPAVRPTVTPQASPSHLLVTPLIQPAQQRTPGLPRLLALCEALALPLAAMFIIALFYGARQPLAVGLFEAPWDKLAHTALFAALAALIAASRPSRFDRPGWLMLCALAATAVGGADELHQIFLPGRNADITDFASNIVGAFLGVAAWSTFGGMTLQKRLG